MITQETVFVLGAGASKPYDFPLGFELYRDVLNSFSPTQHGRRAMLESTSFQEDEIDSFLAALGRSGSTSVDAFLENRIEFMEIGKAAMAIVLIQKENESTLWNADSNWLVYVFQRLKCRFEEFGNNRVSFVTFNYDRSLEHFLITSIQHSFGKSIEECVKILEPIKIIHLHGSLGLLPWQKERAGEGRHYRDYNSRIDRHAVRASMREIKVVHEELDENRDRQFNEARDLLSKADHIYFFGFGFGAKNVERLNLKDLAVGKAFATGNGLSTNEANDIQDGINGRVSIRAGADCIGMLRNNIRLK